MAKEYFNTKYKTRFKRQKKTGKKRKEGREGETVGPIPWGFVGQGKRNICLLRIFKSIMNYVFFFKQLKYGMHTEKDANL